MLRESKLGRWYQGWVERVPASLCERLALQPNQLTFLAFFCSLLIPPVYFYSAGWGGLTVLVAGALDTLDGSLARATGRQSKTGAFLDSVLDRTGDFLIHLGLWLFFLRHVPFRITPLTLILLFSLHGSFLVSYARARGEGLGLSTSVGLFGRGERILVWGLGSIFSALLAFLWPEKSWARQYNFLFGLLALLAVGVHVSAVKRIIHIARRLP